MATNNSPRPRRKVQSIACSKPSGNGKAKHAITPDDLRDLQFACESAATTWLEAHAPADVREVSHFANVAREALAQQAQSDSSAVYEFFQHSIAEALPDAQAALDRLNKKPPADSLFALEAPIITPEFVDMLEMHARQHLYDWLKANAPHEVFELYRLMASLEIYNDDIERNGGQVTRDGNLSIAGSVTGCINAIAATGGTFEGGGMRSIVRKVCTRKAVQP
jgi:hypothetical protein